MNQISIFRGIPYARAARFGKPELLDFQPEADYSQRGPICPQGDTGDELWGFGGTNEESEDCLVLSVFAPKAQENGLLPVFVMVHGGSYRHGGGERSCQDLEELAALTNTVCVSVSYRFSAWGYQYDPELCPPNLGLQDQLAALEWVSRHIARFGGDASRITLCGQSAGAQSVAYMLASPDRPQVKQALLFSAPMALSMKAGKAAATSRGLYTALGAEDETAGRRMALEADTLTLLKAMKTADHESGLPMPFMPAGVEHKPAAMQLPPCRAVVTTQATDGSFYGKRLLWPFLTAYVFAWPARNYVRYLRKQGVDTTYHRFGWVPGHSAYGACHCSELLLFLGTAESWVGCRLAGDLTVEQLNALRARFIPKLGHYIHTGEWTLPADISKD